ncbi:MAG: flavodoxin domain-containing protein [Firmicutes bacterium]|nr:flavodoxin domain-containing protein [Bacillota bacterium]
MKTAVRYYSRSGNTEAAAKAIARAAGTTAVSVDAKDAPIQEPVDVLFIGGALYAYGIDEHLKTYIRSLQQENVRKAVIFSTSWISKHAIDLIRSELSKRGIKAAEETLYFRGKPGDRQIKEAEEFTRKELS